MNESKERIGGFSPETPKEQESLEVGVRMLVSELAKHPDRTLWAFTIDGREGTYVLYADGKTVNRVFPARRETDGDKEGKILLAPSHAESINEDAVITIAEKAT